MNCAALIRPVGVRVVMVSGAAAMAVVAIDGRSVRPGEVLAN
ncbi:MAG TPA: hypothetical protein VH684_15815 [Xanthobacteraceae bacterium]